MASAAKPVPASSPGSGASHNRYTSHPLALGVLTTVFFMWGFLTSLNDILIPHLKSSFQLSYAEVMLVQFTFFGAYFLMGMPAGWLVARLGYKKGIVAGLAIAGLGALGFWPAASLHWYPAFLGTLFVLATGITVLQVAANPYVALLGSEETSSSRLTLAQAFNSLGTTLAPLFGGLLILATVTSVIPESVQQAPETAQLISTINQQTPDQALAAIRSAPPERSAAAIVKTPRASLEKLPTQGLITALDRLSPSLKGDVLLVLPTDKLLATLKAQSADQITAIPVEKLVPALDKLRSVKLDDAQAASLKQFLAGIPDTAAQHLQAYRNTQGDVVKAPYAGLAVVLFLLTIFVWLFRLPALTESTAKDDHGRHSFAEVLRHPHVLFGVLGIFFYVGAEVSIGSFMVNYLSMPDIGNMSEQQAARYVAFYWGGAMIGRFIGSALMAKISPRKLLATFAAINALLVATTMLSTGNVAMYSIIAIGLFNSIMFPTIFALGIERLGPMTSKASSLLIMAIVGGAVIPQLQGVIADHIGLHHAFFLPLLCYLYIVFYGVSGSKIRSSVD